MAKRGKINGGIFDDQPRYADCGCCREYSIDKAEFSVMRKRERQKQCTAKYQCYKAKKNNFYLLRMYLLSFN